MKALPIALALALAASSCPASEGPPRALSLEEAKQEALRNHPAFAAAQLKELLAKEQLKETRAAFYPAAGGYVDAVDTGEYNTRILAGGINNPSVFDRVGEGVAVSQLITDFGRTSNLSRGAKSQERAASEGTEASREQILVNVVANYLATLQAQEVLRVAEQTLENRTLTARQVNALEQNKLKSGLDVSLADVAEEQAELLVQDAQGGVDGAMASLSAALGERGGESIILTDNPAPAVIPGSPDALVATAISERPDLRDLRYQVEAAHSAARAEKDASYPTLAAVGLVGNSFTHDERLPDKYAVAGVQFSVPFFQGGAYEARQHEAEIRERVLSENLREAEDNAARDVRLAFVAAQTAKKRLATTKKLLASSNQALSLAEARYKAGSSSIIELSDSQLAEASAAIAYANAEYDTRIQAAVLEYQTGSIR
ncbi:MAG TPA: TolC family protein [Opitutaceae bacterium]|jgi:outer membrane protein